MEQTTKAKVLDFCKNHWALILYIGLVLPFCTYFLAPDVAPTEDRTMHLHHQITYIVLSILSTLAFVIACYLLVCREKCSPEKAFFWKVVAAIGGPFILILCNVVAPWWWEPKTPLDLYRSYLIGRLCFLMAITMLFSIWRVDEMPEKQYEEGLVQLRMAWAAFALLFASDPVLARLSNAYTQNSTAPAQVPPDNVIGALVHLNFCGGITLLLLPLWKLSKLRREMMTRENMKTGGVITTSPPTDHSVYNERS